VVNFYFLEYYFFYLPFFTTKTDDQYLPKVFVYYKTVKANYSFIKINARFIQKNKSNFNLRYSFSFYANLASTLDTRLVFKQIQLQI